MGRLYGLPGEPVRGKKILNVRKTLEGKEIEEVPRAHRGMKLEWEKVWQKVVRLGPTRGVSCAVQQPWAVSWLLDDQTGPHCANTSVPRC